MKSTIENSRRKFLSKLALTAGATAGLSAIPKELIPGESITSSSNALEADIWFLKNVKGVHRVVYDAPEPHDGFPVIWSWVFMTTNNETGTRDEDMTSMVVLRHNTIAYALNDAIYEKYDIGEFFGVKDARTGKWAKRNPMWEPKEGDFPASVIQGIKQQQSRGALFCVCEMAMKMDSGDVARKMKLDPEEVKKDWYANLHPGIQPVPSGVWALGRAQEHGCKYIYAGG